MNLKNSTGTLPTAAALAAASATRTHATTGEVDTFIGELRSEPTRGAAIERAVRIGVAGAAPLCDLLADKDVENRRAARRCLDRMVHHAGRPGASGEARELEAALLAAIPIGATLQARREILWLLSEIGGAATVKGVTPLLANPHLGEDVRCVLQRIPGKESLDALKAALKTAPEALRPSIAESLRKRGEKVRGYPSQRLTPVKATSL